MESQVDAIGFKVRQALYASSSTSSNFRAFSNRLVNEGTLSDEQFDQHHMEISRLYDEWQTGSQMQHCQHRRYTLPTNQSPPTQETTSSTTSVPQPEEGQTGTAAEMLKAAVISIDKNRELLDAPTTWLYLPSSRIHATVPVTMMKTSCSQSYIRAKTLEQNDIEWEGTTVVLHWKSMAIRGDEDQRVEKTVFKVVDEQVASNAGLRFDMLVGKEHGLSVKKQARAHAVEGARPDDSSATGRNHDLAAQSSVGSSNDAEQRPPSGQPRISQSQILIRIELT